MFGYLKVLVCLSLLAAISVFFFTSFGVGSKSEWSTDVEHVVSSLSAEAEKELFSIDDSLYLICSLCVLAGAYFGAMSIGAIAQQYDTPLFLIALPTLAFSMLGIPVNLLFDFGGFFLLYLRGAAASKSVLFELALDYVAVMAFFTRLVVQFVRLAIMFVVYFMMHEGVMVYQVGQNFIPFSGSLYADTFNNSWGKTGVGYFFITTLPAQLGYWLFDSAHTMGVITMQISTFGTIAL
jgi:hypothetical protein